MAVTTRLKPRKQPSQERSSVTVDATVEAAIRILQARGYASVTTTRVADLAGVSVGSLYQCFPSREAIVAEIVVRQMARIRTALLEASTENAASLEQAIGIGIEALLVEKRRSIKLAEAIREAMPDVEGRAIVIEASRALVLDLAEKLAPQLEPLPPSERVASLSVGIAAVEGALTETTLRQPTALQSPDIATRLVQVFMSALAIKLPQA